MAGVPALETPAAVAAAGDLIDDVDRALVDGLGRLDETGVATVEELADGFAGTPLGDRLADAADAVARGSFDPSTLTAIAAGRASLQGARHDALVAHLAETVGWQVSEVPPRERATPDDLAGPSENVRSWLAELALTGFGRLDEGTVTQVDGQLQRLRTVPEATRLLATVSGFRDELHRNVPTSQVETVPARRWADLWSRATVATTGLPETTAERVDGRFRPLGTDLQHHATAVTVVVYGLFDRRGPSRSGDDADGSEHGEDAEPTRFTRISLTSFKLRSIGGRELWRLFPDRVTPLLEAVVERQAVDLTDVDLLATGELRLTEGTETSTGDRVDPFETAEAVLGDDGDGELTVLSPAPLDRHPAQIVGPVYLDDYDVERPDDGDGGDGGDGDGESTEGSGNGDGDHLPQLVGGDSRVALDTERISPFSRMEPGHVTGSSELVGLLRYDGGWTVQPLVETRRIKPFYAGLEEDPTATADSVEVLRERADKLLRSKS